MKHLGAGALGAALLLLTGCTIASESAAEGTKVKDSTSVESTPEPAAEEDEDSPEPEPEVEPSPDGTYSSSCDYLLGDFTEYTPKGFRFVADATLHNTGNIGTVTKVTAIWFQAGGGKITESKTVKVKAGHNKRVGFLKQVGGDEIDLIQAIDGKQCRVAAAIVDTFGPVT